MSYVQKLLDNNGLLRSSGTSLEIEIKLIIDPRIRVPRFIKNRFSEEMSILFAKNLIEKLKKTGSRFQIEETINFIERGPTNLIKQLVFENGIQQKSKKNFYTKKPLTNPVFLLGNFNSIPLKFSIAEEKKIQPTKVQANLVRSKLRLSIFHSDKFTNLQNWRIDITLTKSIDKVSSLTEIKNIRNKLFPTNLTFENFETVAPWKYADSIELEVESLNPETVTEQTISQITKELVSESEPIELIGFQGKIYEISQLLVPHISHKFKPPQNHGLKKMANNVIELTRNTYFSDLQPIMDKFFITDKADGVRTFLYLIPRQGQAYGISPNELFSFEIPNKDLDLCIADSEKIKDNYLIFDVMLFDGKKIHQEDFITRKEFIPRFSNLSSNFYEKKFVESTGNVADEVCKFNTAKRPFPYNLDGIIFTGKSGSYSQTINYKWKPYKETTIDFLIRECPKSLLGIDPYISQTGKKLYLLFVGIEVDMMKRLNINFIHRYRDIFLGSSKKSHYIPIQFSPSSNPYAYLFWHERIDLNKKIGEMHYDVESKKWTLHKIRDDKTRDAEMGVAFGNDFRISELVWQNYFNPITMDDLKMSKEEGLKNAYFKKHNVDLYKSMRTYGSFVKENLYKAHAGSSWAVDLASGKGQDLFRYIRAKIPNVLFIDIDKMALNELITRKYSFSNPHSKYYDPNATLNINILEADLNDNYKINLSKISKNGISIPDSGVPLIVCNFGIHYMVGTDDMRKNFIQFIDSLLAKKGRFIFTTFDGEKVFNLLQSNRGEWNHFEGEKLKYSLKQEYLSTEFTGDNQKIKVLQPFSEDTYYSEYLVNHDILEKEFEKFGFRQEVSESFDIYQESFRKHNKSMYDKMSNTDKMYISLYTANVYYKS